MFPFIQFWLQIRAHREIRPRLSVRERLLNGGADHCNNGRQLNDVLYAIAHTLFFPRWPPGHGSPQITERSNRFKAGSGSMPLRRGFDR